jgi:hypothetical protein
VGPEDSLRYAGKLGLGTYYRNRAYFDDVSVNRLASVVGLEDQTDGGFRLYPNPAGDLLTLEYKAGIERLAIINILGYAVKVIDHPPGHRTRISLAALEKGLYIVRYIGTAGNAHTGRFIKQ